jgi:hypothetical protein
LKDYWNIDVVCGKLEIDPLQLIAVDLIPTVSVCKGESAALADQTLDLRDAVFDRFGRETIVQSLPALSD